MARQRQPLFLEQLEAREVLDASAFPVTNNGIYLLSDQLMNMSSYSAQLTDFIATHFVGTEKLTAAQNAQFTAVNPNWVLLNYRLGTASGPAQYILPSGQWGSDWSTVNANESWFMHNPTDGTRDYFSASDWYLNDISNPAFDQYFVSSTIQSMQATGAVGLMADSFEAGVGGWWFTESDPRFAGTNAGNPAAWPGGNTWTDQMEAFTNYVQQQFAAAPQKFLFLPNVDAMDTGWETFDYNMLDGAFLENFGEQGPGYLGDNTADWVLEMNRALPMSAAGKVLVMQPYLHNAANTALGLEQRGFDLGTYLLLQGDHTYLNLGGSDGTTDAFYYPEDSIAIGSPLSPTATSVSQYAWDGIYRRDFQNGIVLVNPTASTVTVTLPQSYRLASFSGGGGLSNASVDAAGNYTAGSVSYSTVNTVTLAPSTGYILLNTTNPSPPPSPSPSGAQLGDAGFESPSVGTGSFGDYQYNPAGTPWTFGGTSGNGSGIAGNGSGFTSNNPNAPQGTQVGFIQGTGSISQSVTLAAGTYDLTFYAAQRGSFQSRSQTFQVQVDGTSVGNFTPAGSTYSALTTNSFTVTAGSHTIKFVGLNPKGGDNTALLDNVTIQSVSQSPPPSPPTSTVTQPGNAGFESPSVGTGAFVYNPGGTAWTFSAQSGVSGNGSGFTAGTPHAPQGTQVGFLQMTGSISQAVTFAAGTYDITFAAAQRGNYGVSTQEVQVLVDGSAVGAFTPAGTSYSTLTTNAFTVTAGAHTIKFVGLNPKGGDNTAFLDNVTIQAVSQSPPPSPPPPPPPATITQPSDAGFESPSVGTGSFGDYAYNPSGTGWTFGGTSGNGSGISGNGSGFTGSNPNAPQGTQVAFIQGTGSISQSVTLAAGTYDLTFYAAQRAGYQSSSQTFQVQVDGVSVGNFTPSGSGYSTLTTSSFTVTAGAHTIKFVGLNPNGGDNTALLDNVTIQSA